MVQAIETDSRKSVSDIFLHAKQIPELTPPDYADLYVIANGPEVWLLSEVARSSIGALPFITYNDKVVISRGLYGTIELGWLNCDSLPEKSKADIGFLVMQRKDGLGIVRFVESMNLGATARKYIILDAGSKSIIIETELVKGFRAVKHLLRGDDDPKVYPSYPKLWVNFQHVIRTIRDTDRPIDHEELFTLFTALEYT